MKIIGIIYGILFILPILIIGFWWISLPLYYLLLGLEFWSLQRVERETGRTKGLIRMITVQTILPLTPIALYPLMPGQTQTGEPLGMNEKAYFAVYAGIILSLTGFVVFGIVRRLALKRTHEMVEQSPPPYSSPAAGSESGGA
jgi:hypothetical protein